MRELFIYYRLAACDPAAVAAALSTFQACLRAAHPGLRTRVLYRPALVPNDGQTWMETYAFDPQPDALRATTHGGVSEALQAEIEARARVALAPWGEVARHIEVFVPCA